MVEKKTIKKKTGKTVKKSGKKSEKQKKERIIQTVGKRKKAVARASFKKGKGIVRLNSKPIELIQPELIRLKVQEPLKIAGDVWRGFDVRIVVKGGGPMGQAEAARQALARGLVEIAGSDLKQKYLSYDRNLLVYDPRRTEPRKPPHSSWGARRYKQRSKR
jgi:small subunit ribosomal protein S9